MWGRYADKQWLEQSLPNSYLVLHHGTLALDQPGLQGLFVPGFDKKSHSGPEVLFLMASLVEMVCIWKEFG